MTADPRSAQAAAILQSDASVVIDEINRFTATTFRTRGGRLGSGMGSLLEAMWVYYMNGVLANQGGLARECEVGWLQDHEPADFACLVRGAHWEPSTRQGELFRIEAKSMNEGVDEPKGHFANLAAETAEHDQLLVIIWSWVADGLHYAWPRITDYFLGPSLPIIRARDALHLARGGRFVEAANCPDGCIMLSCSHQGEPLNSSGKRERRSGPQACRPANVDYAANFGGLVRMLKTDTDDARRVFRHRRAAHPVVHDYISFIHRHFPREELHQYSTEEWRSLYRSVTGSAAKLSKDAVQAFLQQNVPDYRGMLRDYFAPR